MHMAVPTSQSAFNAANNRLAAAGYDAAGNMTSHPWITPGGSMAYNVNNLMTSFTATGVSVQTAYDAEGRRVRKIKGTEVTLWVYDASGRLAAEYRNGSGPGFAASTPEREYSYGVGRLVAVHEGTNRYYRTTDHLGSTRIVTDQTGAVKQRRDFFPFGEEIPADSSHGGRNAVLDGGVATHNAFLSIRQEFTGQERDSDTGLDYFWARNFSAPLGRFLSVDPENAGACARRPQGWNAYAYVFNCPTMLYDPDGRQCRPDAYCVEVQAAAPTIDPLDFQYYEREFGVQRPPTGISYGADGQIEPWTPNATARYLQSQVQRGEINDCEALSEFAETLSMYRRSTDDFVNNFNTLIPRRMVNYPLGELLGIGGVPLVGDADGGVLLESSRHPSGYRGPYRDGWNQETGNPGSNGDQAHHFAAYFILGYSAFGGDPAHAYLLLISA